MVLDPSGATNNSTIRRASADTPTACRVSPNRCFNSSTSPCRGPHSICPAAGAGHTVAANKNAARAAAFKPKRVIISSPVSAGVNRRLRFPPLDQPLRPHSSLGYQSTAPETVLPNVEEPTYSVDGFRSALQLNPRAQLSHKRWTI